MKNLICLLSFLGVIHVNAQSNASPQPNIFFIIADDLASTDIGCYGSKNVRTPHIDAITAEGMRFERAFQAAPMCLFAWMDQQGDRGQKTKMEALRHKVSFKKKNKCSTICETI